MALTGLLFITLRKSEALFSPSTRYRDLVLGRSLFHWESQSTTTAAAATGQRTIHHEARDWREQRGRAAARRSRWCGPGLDRFA